MPIVCAAVVGPANNPLFMGLYPPAGEADAPVLAHMVHASLDAVEERLLLRRGPAGSGAEPYLGLLYPTQALRVYGAITNSAAKLVLVLDEAAPREEVLSRLLARLAALYVDARSNPLASGGDPITSAAFAAGVAALVAGYASGAA